ncbi:MAG: hypothetical protein K2I18_09320, partial [Paramuribaculum sp.]|nr:hypothetical protein [Paramuribaculum sp.]
AIEILAELSPATRHKVMDAAVHYCKTGEMPENLSKNVMALFKTLMALSKVAIQVPESAPDANGTPRKRQSLDQRIVENSLKKITDTFTWPQYLTDRERAEEQALMVKVRDAVMNRYDILRTYKRAL